RGVVVQLSNMAVEPLAMCYPGLVGGTLDRLKPRFQNNSGLTQGVPAWPWQAERETDLRRAKAKGATVLAHRLRLYFALHKGADALDGRSRFRKDPRPDLPGVRHPRPYFEFYLTSGGAHPLRHAHGIIEEDLVAADLDERRRQSGRVGVKRGRIRRARIGAGKIIAREPRALRASQHRIGVRVSLQGIAGEREIGPGRKRDSGGRQRNAFVT